MNQSLATLIRVKLFQGGNNNGSNPNVGDLDTGKPMGKKSKRWIKAKRSDKKEESPQVGSEFHDADSHKSETSSISGIENGNATNSPSNQEENNLGTISQNDESNGKQESTEYIAGLTNSRAHGKLRTFKQKMSIPELHFRSSSGSSRHSRKSLEMSKKSESLPPHGPSKSARVYSMFPASLSPKRMSLEYSYKSATECPKHSFERPSNDTAIISKTVSNSSTSSSKFSPRKINALNSSSATSSVRFINPVTSTNGDGTSSSLDNCQSTSLSNSKSHHHSKAGSMEIKNGAGQTLLIGRRRSRTVDVSDYTRKINLPSQSPVSTNNDFISSITTHLKKSRSNSLLTKTSMASPLDRGGHPNTSSVHEKGSVSPPKVFESSAVFSGIPVQSVVVPSGSGSRRSSSIVNALNSFVNLRSSSASSVKGSGSKAVTPKFDLTLDDFPTPPEPEPNESYRSYLSRLAPYGKFIAVILCQKNEPYKNECLAFYLSNFFDFRGDPLDISLRKLLMFLELPLETQQIDRLLTEFSKCYYETQSKTEDYCPWSSENQVYLVGFSLLMLHTDFFNPHNKFKMTKSEFIHLLNEDNISGGCDIPKEILAYYYDNITAKESPKFDFSVYQQLLQSYETHSEDSSTDDALSSNFYSPISIVKGSGSCILQDHAPASYTLTGRASSNSFSSYFPQIPASNSSSTNSIIQDDIDIYSHILEDSLKDINMSSQVEQVWNETYLYKALSSSDNKCDKYFSILNETKGGYLRINKNQIARVAVPNFEILNESDDDHALLKIIHMGEIRELTANKKFSIVGSVNKIFWKNEYAILTSCGLLIFDNADWISPSMIRDKSTGTSNYIIDCKSNASMLTGSPLTCNGLLAINKEAELAKLSFSKFDVSELDIDDHELTRNSDCQTSNLSDCTLHLYGSQKKFVWRCANKNERDHWIDSINVLAAYDGCFCAPGGLNNVLISQRKHNIKDRLDKLDKGREEKSKKLISLQSMLPLYRQAIPLSFKTRNDITFHIKQLAVRMDWLVYEIKRNQLYVEIIEQVSTQLAQFSSQDSKEHEKATEDELSSMNESFIFNDELLQACLTEDYSR